MRSPWEEALANVKRLHDILPICICCKKILKDQNCWRQVDAYIGEHTDSHFSHGI